VVSLKNMDMSKTKSDTLEYLQEKINRDKRHVISLGICGNCDKNCLSNMKSNKKICDKCNRLINRRLKNDSKKAYNDPAGELSKIRILLGFKKSLKMGKTFILNVSPKSFQNLKKKPNRLKAYQEIVKYKMKRKCMDKVSSNKEIRLCLMFHIKNYYSNSDCDNMAKSICDALQDILYHKDSQIKQLICEKHKVPSRKDEGIVVSVDVISS
jgi:Holliday junction resolvase RusA-like endonuclease